MYQTLLQATRSEGLIDEHENSMELAAEPSSQYLTMIKCAESCMNFAEMLNEHVVHVALNA